MADYLPLTIERNGNYLAKWYLDDENGAGIDVSTWAYKLDIKYAAGQANPPLASATIVPTNPTAGEITVKIEGADFDAVPGAFEPVNLAYDFVAVTPDGPRVIAKGPLRLEPGVSL